jgi:hypothetical protein
VQIDTFFFVCISNRDIIKSVRLPMYTREAIYLVGAKRTIKS